MTIVIATAMTMTNDRVSRGARADADVEDALILIKNVSTLTLTYQIRLLAFRASEADKILIIEVPKACKIDKRLQDFVRRFPHLVRVEKV